MKTHCSRRHRNGLTLLEVLVVVLLLAFIAMLILPTLSHPNHHRSLRISCVINLKETALAFRIWEGDNNDVYPMLVSCTNGGAMEQIATGQVARVFEVMSNELSTPKILVCPADTGRFPATNFATGFSAQNISYFVGVNASQTNPKMMLAGDDNFELGGVPIKSGLLNLSAARHKFCGNVAMAVGRVQQLSTQGLRDCGSLATNRIAIP